MLSLAIPAVPVHTNDEVKYYTSPPHTDEGMAEWVEWITGQQKSNNFEVYQTDELELRDGSEMSIAIYLTKLLFKTSW